MNYVESIKSSKILYILIKDTYLVRMITDASFVNSRIYTCVCFVMPTISGANGRCNQCKRKSLIHIANGAHKHTHTRFKL